MNSKYLLVGCRVMSFISMAPGFSGRQIPAAWKVGLGAWMALALGSQVSGFSVDLGVATDVVNFMFLICREAVMGMLMGFCAGLAMSAATNAGWLIDQSMGIGVVNVIDPQYGTATPLMGNYLTLLSIVLWFGCDGHHLLLVALKESFAAVPPGAWPSINLGGVLRVCVAVAASATAMGFSLAIPALGASLIVDVWLGLLSRSFTQLNAFIIGLPLKMLAVLGTLALSLGVLSRLGSWVTEEMGRALRLLFEMASTGA